MSDPDIADYERRMNGAVGVLKNEFSGLRAGRASVGLLEPVQVEAYGSKTPLNQVGNVGAPESRLLTVQVWDASLVSAVESAIRDAGLGLNPMSEGNLIRIPIPELSEERRSELVKIAGKYAEKARVAIRNIRRDAMDKIKHMEKDGDISQDAHRDWADKITNLTNKNIDTIDSLFSTKRDDILRV